MKWSARRDLPCPESQLESCPRQNPPNPKTQLFPLRFNEPRYANGYLDIRATLNPPTQLKVLDRDRRRAKRGAYTGCLGQIEFSLPFKRPWTGVRGLATRLRLRLTQASARFAIS